MRISPGSSRTRRRQQGRLEGVTRHFPTYYIKAAGEVDAAVIREGRFWPIEIKWMGQLRPKDLKQIRKYHNGVIRARVRSPHSLEGVPVEPLPLALVRLA